MEERRIRRLRLKFPNNSLWKLSKCDFGQFRRQYKFDKSYKEMLEHLNGLQEYYLNDWGLSLNSDGLPVEKEHAKYVWASLGIDYMKEPLFAWMYGNDNGEFHNIFFGTRKDFDMEIVSSHKTLAKASQSKNITDK